LTVPVTGSGLLPRFPTLTVPVTGTGCDGVLTTVTLTGAGLGFGFCPNPVTWAVKIKAPASKTNVACRKFKLIFLTSWDYFFLLRDKLYFRGVLAFTVFEYAESPAEFTARIR